MSASSPLLGLFRFTSEITLMPGARKCAIGSRAGGACSAKDLIWENETRSSRSARSIRTPATKSSRTDMPNIQDQGRTQFVTLKVKLTQWPSARQAPSPDPHPAFHAPETTPDTTTTPQRTNVCEVKHG